MSCFLVVMSPVGIWSLGVVYSVLIKWTDCGQSFINYVIVEFYVHLSYRKHCCFIKTWHKRVQMEHELKHNTHIAVTCCYSCDLLLLSFTAACLVVFWSCRSNWRNCWKFRYRQTSTQCWCYKPRLRPGDPFDQDWRISVSFQRAGTSTYG